MCLACNNNCLKGITRMSQRVIASSCASGEVIQWQFNCTIHLVRIPGFPIQPFPTIDKGYPTATFFCIYLPVIPRKTFSVYVIVCTVLSNVILQTQIRTINAKTCILIAVGRSCLRFRRFCVSSFLLFTNIANSWSFSSTFWFVILNCLWSFNLPAISPRSPFWPYPFYDILCGEIR